MTPLVLCGLALEIILLITAGLLTRTARDASLAHLLPLALLLACVPYVIAVYCARSVEWKRARWWILAVALIGRLTILPTPLMLSDDALRYLWEGRVQQAGINPYRYTPDAPELAAVRDSHWQIMPHKETLSVYPPFLQWAYLLGAVLRPVPEVYKVVFAAFDLGTLWFIVRLLRLRGQNESLAVIWAWSPLVIVEFSGGGHEMSMAIFFLVMGLWLLEKNSVWAGAALAAALQSQFLAGPAVVAVILGRREQSARFWGPFMATMILPYLPYIAAAPYLVKGLGHLAGWWRFNGSAFDFLLWSLGGGPSFHILTDINMNHLVTKLIMAGLLMAVMYRIWRDRYPACRAALAAMGATLLLSTTVHQWYVAFLVALICFEFRLEWLTFGCVVFFAYIAKVTLLQEGQWIDHRLVGWLEYLPVYALLALQWRRSRHIIAAPCSTSN